jgi:hypothetical protein
LSFTRLLALGDIHGRTIWQKILANETYDKLIFIGDYFDSKEGITAEQQITNFKNIIQFKKSHPDKVVLLLGNHDFHYLNFSSRINSGYQKEYASSINKLLHNAIDAGLIQMAFQYDDILFTHAGVTNTWLTNNKIKRTKNIANSINALFKNNPLAFEFIVKPRQQANGDNIYQSCIWVRPTSLFKDAIQGLKQVVGHTQQEKIEGFHNITFIDTLGSSGEYLVIENDEFSSYVIE